MECRREHAVRITGSMTSESLLAGGRLSNLVCQVFKRATLVGEMRHGMVRVPEEERQVRELLVLPKHCNRGLLRPRERGLSIDVPRLPQLRKALHRLRHLPRLDARLLERPVLGGVPVVGVDLIVRHAAHVGAGLRQP